MDRLPDPRNVICDKNICEVKETAGGVTAICSDGSSYEADIIIGADGVSSKVRTHVNRSSNRQVEGKAQEDRACFDAHHICLWIRFSSDGLRAGSTFETHGNGASTQMFVSPDHAVAGVYEKLSEPIRQRRRFTDAAHVFTSITGAGCNNGILDVVVLVNELRCLLDAKITKPDTEELRGAFDSYESCRKEKAIHECRTATQVAATASWQSTFRRLTDQYLISLSWVQKLMVKQASTKIASIPSFYFLPADEHVHGKIPWCSSGFTANER